jgi:DNA-binding NarL/FixJ family response regulator
MTEQPVRLNLPCTRVSSLDDLLDALDAKGNPMTADAGQPSDDGSGRPRLLIADDDAFVRSALSRQLEANFEIVAVARDAVEAIELAEKHRPDGALIDVDMPGGGAREAVPQISIRSPDTCMVILSSDETREVVLELLSAGAIAYLRKGVSGPELCEKLTAAMAVKADQQRA